MAVSFLSGINLNQNQLLQARIENVGTDPAFGVLGQIIFQTSAGSLKVCTVASIGALPTAPATWSVVGSAGTTYTLPVGSGAGNSATIALTDAASAVASTVTFNSVASQTAVSETTGQNGSITIGLAPSIIITGTITAQGTGQNSFTGPITIPLTPTAATDAASKGYVDSSNIGQSVFQGGYDANLNVPDLDAAPSALIKKGWFWAVTVRGNFFAEEVQPGDLIYANQDNPGPTFANWTVVQSGQDIAADGASDATTRKGVAGFNSAHFNVTANGWVSSDIYTGSSNLGIVPSGGTSNTVLKGDATWSTFASTVTASTVANRLGLAITPTSGAVVAGLSIEGLTDITTSTVSDDSLPIYDLSATTNKRVTVANLAAISNTLTSTTGTIGIGALSGTVSHGFGLNTMVQTIDSLGNTIFCDVARTSTSVTATIAAAQTGIITILVSKIG